VVVVFPWVQVQGHLKEADISPQISSIQLYACLPGPRCPGGGGGGGGPGCCMFAMVSIRLWDYRRAKGTSS